MMETLPTPRPEDIPPQVASVVKPGGLVETPGEYLTKQAMDNNYQGRCHYAIQYQQECDYDEFNFHGYLRPASWCESCRPSAYVRTFCAM